MRRRIAVSLFALALLIGLALLSNTGSSRDAQASPPPRPACSTCQTTCVNTCTKHGSSCQYAASVCFDPQTGDGGCSFICVSGETGGFQCDCTSTQPPPPGGSPIFKKQPTTSPTAAWCRPPEAKTASH